VSGAKPIRWLLAAVVTIAVVVVLALLLVATDTLLSVYQRLVDIHPWLGGAYLVFLAAAAVTTAVLVWRLLKPRPRTRVKKRGMEAPSREALAERIEDARSRGMDIDDGEAEFLETDRRRSQGRVYLALFGEASAGKSTLIGALLPGARPEADPRRGTTTAATIYEWQPTESETQVRLVDLPGFGQSTATGDGTEVAREEAIRAHLVLYVCDGDLTRSQFAELEALGEFRKPLVLVINKADRYAAEELARIEGRIAERLGDLEALSIIPVTAGGSETVEVEAADGSVTTIERQRPPDVERLCRRIEDILGGEQERLEADREQAGLQLTAVKLDDAQTRYRRQQAETLVERYSRRAVIGALAAVTPGADLVIQGALASALVRSLTNLYDIPVREVDLDRFVERAGSRLGRLTGITLAVAGNALKAFPGVGTLAGGAVHAVAYGLIFNSLGRAIAACLADRAELDTEYILERVEQSTESDLAAGAKRLARIALSRRDD